MEKTLIILSVIAFGLIIQYIITGGKNGKK